MRKSEAKKTLGRPRRRRDNKIKMHRQVGGLEGAYCSDMAQDRDKWPCEHSNGPSNSIKCGQFLE